MGKQIMARKRGLKRSKPHGIKKSKKHDSLPSTAAAGHDSLPSPAAVGDAALEEDVSAVSMEPSTFHNLLKALGSGSQKLANLYKRREQEGRSDSEEDDEDDEDDGYESDGLFEEEEDGEEGLDNESSLEGAGEGLRKCRSSDILKEGKRDVSEDDEEVFDADDVHDTESETFNNVDEAENTSPFQRHLGHTLSTEDAENLMKEQWKYKWEMPAINISMSKWVGTGEHLPEEVSNDMDHGIKQRLYENWLNICGNSGSSDFNSSRWRSFFSLCNSYHDIMHCSKKPFYLKGVEEDSIIMDAYIMHALNHVYKTRDLVIKNDAKLAKHQESGIEDVLGGGTFLDQGFTRPKVMFLLPLRSIALRVMRRLIQLAPLSKKDNVQHWDRFSKEFGSVDVEEEDDANGGSSRSRKSAKPVDYQLLFGGNNDDNFMLGIKFTKRSIKLYSDFYSSDIIIASPVGLLPKIEDTRIEKEKDIDYLSSIEVLIIDHADVIAMQNWSHLNTVVEQLNHLPSKQHGTDVMRIRQWYLDGHARFYRQTILLSSFLNPDMNAMFNRLCLNYEGKVKLISECKGVLPKVLLQVRQVYERFQAPSIVDSDDSRLDYFCKKVFPKITDSIEGGTMLFISSYFELVRIRNFLKSQNASFCLLDEYRKQSDISRARVWFFEGKRKIMLYTERAHYYHRYKIRGIQNLIIYSLPERKDFYPEILNMLEGSEKMVCNVLFSRYDQLKLERIVGTAAAKRMVSSEKNAFVFC